MLFFVKNLVDELGWNGTLARQPVAKSPTPGEWVIAIPLEQSDATLLGAFCVQQSISNLPTYPTRHAADLARRLKPLLDSNSSRASLLATVRSIVDFARVVSVETIVESVESDETVKARRGRIAAPGAAAPGVGLTGVGGDPSRVGLQEPLQKFAARIVGQLSARVE